MATQRSFLHSQSMCVVVIRSHTYFKFTKKGKIRLLNIKRFFRRSRSLVKNQVFLVSPCASASNITIHTHILNTQIRAKAKQTALTFYVSAFQALQSEVTGSLKRWCDLIHCFTFLPDSTQETAVKTGSVCVCVPTSLNLAPVWLTILLIISWPCDLSEQSLTTG